MKEETELNSTPTYFGNRQNATGATPNELEDIFKCIVDHFSDKWLTTRGSNPLQQLWERKDVLATNELYSFGFALKKLSIVDAKWTKAQVVQIKSDHVNNRQGAFFEINGLSILSQVDQSVVPTKGNNPGFDGVLTNEENKTMRISMKNYGDSAHYNEFKNYSSKVEKKLIEGLKQNGILALHILIDCPNRYPEKKDWEKLFNQLPFILDEAKKEIPKHFVIDDSWIVSCNPIKDDYQEFHAGRNSYTIIVSSPFHKNEEKNLLDKLDDACYNLIKHSNTENENTINAVFIHLPESASILQCVEWAQQYFLMFPDKPITGIILYQPTVAKDFEKETTLIHHCFQMVFREEKFLKWNPSRKQIEFVMPIGIVNTIPTESRLIYEFEGKTETLELKKRYVYQKGNWYLKAKQGPNGSLTGNMKQISSGIFVRSIFQPFPGEAALEISGRFPPDEKLLIL